MYQASGPGRALAAHCTGVCLCPLPPAPGPCRRRRVQPETQSAMQRRSDAAYIDCGGEMACVVWRSWTTPLRCAQDVLGGQQSRAAPESGAREKSAWPPCSARGSVWSWGSKFYKPMSDAQSLQLKSGQRR